MKLPPAVVPIVAFPLLVLTYLLVQGATPNAARHERTIDALRTLTLSNAALQRDVLRARAGILRDYDPLVQSVRALRDGATGLATAADVARGPARAEIVQDIDALTAAIRAQEALVENFKSRNALLQNSLSFFSHLTGELSAADDSRGSGAAGEISGLGNSMLRFISTPDPEIAAEVTAALHRLDRRLETRDAEPFGQSESALISHGRLIVATLPQVDDLVARLQAAPTMAHAQALEAAYLKAYTRAAARATHFRVLLYVAAVALVAYVGFLLLRLHANARILEARLGFEKLIAEVSNRFINLPRERVGEGIEQGLARLAEHAAIDFAHIIVPKPESSGVERTYWWQRSGVAAPAARPEDLLAVADDWHLERNEQGCIHVARVAALPDGPNKERLEHLGIRSWLAIPMVQAGKRVGLLVLATSTAERFWPADDIALMRTASEIFANAIGRARGEAEREGLEVQLSQAQRLEAVGTLASGIAHEFNNILGAILGYGEMALGRLGTSDTARHHVRQIMKAGKRAQGVVDQILAFGRRRPRRCRPIRAQPAIAEGVEFMQATFPAGTAIDARLDAEDAVLMGDPTELQQVVMNLCANAAHAMEGGTISVRLGSVVATDGLVLSHGSLPPGRYIRLAVADSGHGIEPATMERIFEPFFTTKAAGKGTGLGLSTVHGIVTQQGGALNVRSRPGEGATFEAYFPRVEGAADEPQAAEVMLCRGNGQTILFVDDEKPLVLLGEEMLAALGYEPVGFASPSAALSAFRAAPDRFDLAMTDQVMPEMTGSELAAALHRIRPDLPIVLMTGYSNTVVSRDVRASGVREIVEKPLLSATIADCLARNLAAAGDRPRTTVGSAPRSL